MSGRKKLYFEMNSMFHSLEIRCQNVFDTEKWNEDDKKMKRSCSFVCPSQFMAMDTIYCWEHNSNGNAKMLCSFSDRDGETAPSFILINVTVGCKTSNWPSFIYQTWENEKFHQNKLGMNICIRTWIIPLHKYKETNFAVMIFTSLQFNVQQKLVCELQHG